ncbi:MAG: hypothetical protein ACXAB7_21960 [Candidatus Kariarchaeaceae archaeon]|jgi:hypothetical protein
MKLTVKFSNLLAEKLGKVVVIDTNDDRKQLDLQEFIDLIEQQSWADEVLENRFVKNPIILVIDETLIQLSNSVDDFKIQETSEITFQVTFAGG